MRKGIFGLVLVLIAVSWLLTLCSIPNEGYIEQNVNAGDLFIAITTNPALKQNNNGEPFAWHACNGADLFVKGYKAWHDTSWLNNARHSDHRNIENYFSVCKKVFQPYHGKIHPL